MDPLLIPPPAPPPSPPSPTTYSERVRPPMWSQQSLVLLWKRFVEVYITWSKCWELEASYVSALIPCCYCHTVQRLCSMKRTSICKTLPHPFPLFVAQNNFKYSYQSLLFHAFSTFDQGKLVIKFRIHVLQRVWGTYWLHTSVKVEKGAREMLSS